MSDHTESPKSPDNSDIKSDTNQVIVVQLSAKLKKAPPPNEGTKE